MSETPLFSAALNKGQALLPEVYQLARHWQPASTSRALTHEALHTGYLGRATEKRIRDVVAVFSRRFMRGQPQPAAYLRQLAAQVPVAGLFTEVCLIHTAAAHPELEAFIREVYWPAQYSGRRDLHAAVAQDFLLAAQKSGRTGGTWSDGLTERTAQRLMGTLTEFGLLGIPDRRGIRQMRPYQPRPESLVYLAYWLREQGYDALALLKHPYWQLLGLRPADVLPTMRRLALQNWLTVLTAGDLLRLEWAYPSIAALLHDVSQRSLHAVA